MNSTSAMPTRRYRSAGIAVFATMLLAAVMVGASFSGIGRAKTPAADAATRTPTALSGSYALVLTIPGITGESTGPIKGGIDVEAYSWGASNTSAPFGSKSGAGKVTFQNLTISKQTDSTSPALFQACASRTKFPTVTLHIQPLSGGPADSAVITLFNSYVTSCNDSGAGGGGMLESLSFNFSKITYDYTPQGSTTVRHMGWNLAKNVKA